MESQPLFDLSSSGVDEPKLRGAFFTPRPIAEFLARWAIAGRPHAKVLDPTCGDGIFLDAAGTELHRLGALGTLEQQLYGVDIHAPSLEVTTASLDLGELDAQLLEADFFSVQPPGTVFSKIPFCEAVIGNPPFIRYQQHRGERRTISREAALRQGVRLSGLASSWAALLIHASSFLTPDGRLAMVLPAELLTVGYAEPVRSWLRRRFAAVKLVIFERLQFPGALENVVLLLAQGMGGCDAFSLYFVESAHDLMVMGLEEFAVTLMTDERWTDLLLSAPQRQVFRSATQKHFTSLGEYGRTTLGTVTGANRYFTLTEQTRQEFNLEPQSEVIPVSPPGTKHLHSLAFSQSDWEQLRTAGERVWLLWPKHGSRLSPGLRSYIQHGESLGINAAYKCKIRDPWWRPPLTPPSDLFFTYMSHHFPRLISNRARVALVNSMHGLRYHGSISRAAREALPLLALNSLTLLGAELFGRSYGGGVLKMEPREASSLPVPRDDILEQAWETLSLEREALDRQLKCGRWTNVVARVDQVLLRESCGLSADEVSVVRDAAQSLRSRRLSRSLPSE